MTQEEKAIAYDEAVKRAKAAIDIAADKDLVGGVVRTILPELRESESEDERIRKALINLVCTVGEYYLPKLEARNKMLDYLEKQKEQKPVYGSDFKWTNQDERCRGKLIDILELADIKYPATKDSRDELWEWLKELPMKFPNKDAFIAGTLDNDDEWSQTEEILGVDGNPTYYKPQPKQEWSEEDETRLTNILIMLKEYVIHHYSKDDVDKSVDWLENRFKSLRPQYHGDVTMTEAYKMGLEAGKASSWKPSEEQIHAIIEALKYLPNNKDEWMVLNTLVDVFKKLI